MPFTNEIPLFSLPLSSHESGPFLRDDFVGDDSNIALKYLTEINNLLDSDWPLVLFGPSGTGKTAIGQTMSAKLALQSGQKALSYTADEFRRRIASSIETGSMQQFRDSICNASVFFIDDLHLLAGHESAQIELAGLLDRLRANNIPTIFAAGEKFLDGDALSERLASRLVDGLCLQVSAPGYSARRLLFEDTAHSLQIQLSDDELEFLASNLSLTYPRIRSFLSLFATWINSNSSSTENRIDNFLASWLTKKDASADRAESIIRVVSQAFKLKASEIKSASRKKSVVRSRGVAAYLLRDLLKISYSKIGSFFGGRDHSTVMHSVSKIESDLQTDENFCRQVAGIRRLVIEKVLINADSLCE